MARERISTTTMSLELIKAAEEENWSLISSWLANHRISAKEKKTKINWKQKSKGGQTVLHVATQRGNPEIVKKLLEAGAENSKDNSEITPFQTACLWGRNAETVAIFLEENVVKVDDKALYLAVSGGHENMKTINLLLKHECGLRPRALYYSISMGHKEVAMELLDNTKSSDWPSLMRYTTEESDTCFREMIRKMPDVAEEILNRCTKLNPECDVYKDKFQVAFNYEFIEDARTQIESLTVQNPGASDNPTGDTANSDIERGAERTQTKEQGEDWSYESFQQPKKNKWGPSHTDRENHPISIMVQHERLNLLAHPLVASLLYSKWRRFGSCLYVLNLLTYCLFLLLLTIFAFVIKNPQYESCMSIAIDVNGTDIDCGDVGISTGHLTGVFACAILVLLMAAFRLALEVIQIWGNYSSYVKNWINYLEIVLYLTSIVFVWIFHSDCLCPSTWQWQLGVVAVFLGWANLIVFVSNIPFIGIYVLMFSHIFFTFLKVLIFSLLLIVTFGLTFYFAFTQPDVVRSPFSSPQRSLLKVLTMTTGEFEFDSIFRQDPSGESDDIEEIPFLPISVILWIVFIVIMPILFTNLLIGLAVGDISEIREQAEVRKLIQQAKLLLSFEEVLRTFRLQHRFALQHRIVKPFEKLSWYGKLNLRLWGGERYCSQCSLEKVVNSQNCKVETESLRENQTLILELKHSIHEILQLVMAKDTVKEQV